MKIGEIIFVILLVLWVVIPFIQMYIYDRQLAKIK